MFGWLQPLELRLGVLVRNEAGAEVLERLTARDVIVVAVAVDDVLDWLRGHLLDLVDVGGHGLWPAETDWIGRDDAVGGHDEHRLVALVAEDVDIVGPFDLCGRECRRR